VKVMLTRRDVLKQGGVAAALATTAPWWLVRRAHAARREKLIVWQPVALAPQVDKLLREQTYAYAKQAGIKDNELEYVEIGTGQWIPKMSAALEAGIPPDVTRQGNATVSLHGSQGHLLELTDLVEKLQKQAGGFFPVSHQAVMLKGKAYGVPQSVSPWPLVTRMDILDAAKVDPPKTWDEFIEVGKKLQKPPKLQGYGMCLGLHTDADNNVINTIWGYGGKLVEADGKTVALNSPGTVQAVQLIADMYLKHKLIPKGAISWDNQGNNKAYQSRQVIFVLNPSSIFAHLGESDKELYDVTAMLPAPAGPAGAIEELTTTEWLLYKQNPYPELAKGLVEYYMDPENLRVVMEEGGGRWGPPYQGMYNTPFWQSPKFQHWRTMLERGRQFASPAPMTAAASEVLTTSVLARMMHRVLVESWAAEKAVDEAHKKVVEIYARHAEG
jgi:multiple sugar transport system substrate-binding protein